MYGLSLEDVKAYIKEHKEDQEFLLCVCESSSPYEFSKQRNQVNSNLDIDDVKAFVNSYKYTSFQDCLRGFMEEKGLLEDDVRKRSKLDYKYFKKIWDSKKGVSISLNAAYSIGFAMHLNLDEMKELLSHTGKDFNTSNDRDLVLMCFIENRDYDYNKLNLFLVELGFAPLNAVKKDSVFEKRTQVCPDMPKQNRIDKPSIRFDH